MRPVATKIQKSFLLILDLVFGIVLLGAAFIAFPFIVFSIDLELLKNLYVWAFVIFEMLFFGLVSFFANIRPFFLFRKLPEVQAETDGTYLYIHSTKEGKIPLSALADAEYDVTTPYMMSHEFLIHLFSQRYGKVTIDTLEHGKFKLYFIADAPDLPERLTAMGMAKKQELGG